MITDDLGPDVIAASLKGGWGRPLRWSHEIASTNPVALQWAMEGAPEGAVVATDHQTAGKGRWGRTWSSMPGRLVQFSIVLRPALAGDRLGLLTLAVGLGCARGIHEASGLVTSIKWPNDVNARGRKIAGILLETQMSDGRVQAAVAGIGINCLWPRSEFPAELADRATSISAEMVEAGLGDPPTRAQVLTEVLAAVEHTYGLAAHDENRAELLTSATNSSEVLGRDVTVAFVDGRTVEGRAIRLLDNGALEIEVDGAPLPVSVAEITQVRAREPD